jgi:hypothetical protein
MRFLLFIVLVALVSCSRADRLSTRPDQATAQVQGWIPAGTPITQARRIMEQHGFTCSLVTNRGFADLHAADYIYCDRRESSITQWRWQAALVFSEGKVSAVRVTTGLASP